MNLIENLKWRYATKKFDATKKVSKKDISTLKEAIQLSASSYGLQAYKVLIIEDAAIRQQLLPASWHQPQITDASQLILFCNYTAVTPEYVDQCMALKSTVQNIPLEALKEFADSIKGGLGNMSSEEIKIWTAKQTYIALGNLLAACGELKIDACPMEGFEADKYDAILGLAEKGLTSAVAAAIGYRSEEDQMQFAPKVRKAVGDLFETI